MAKENLLIIIFIIFTACNSFKEAGQVLRNEKTQNTDEFLIKKRNPLVLPPDYENIPEPGSIKQNIESEEKKIKKILKASEIETSKTKSSNIEESILNKIKK